MSLHFSLFSESFVTTIPFAFEWFDAVVNHKMIFKSIQSNKSFSTFRSIADMISDVIVSHFVAFELRVFREEKLISHLF
jgi:hypothetical protein